MRRVEAAIYVTPKVVASVDRGAGWNAHMFTCDWAVINKEKRSVLRDSQINDEGFTLSAASCI